MNESPESKLARISETMERYTSLREAPQWFDESQRSVFGAVSAMMDLVKLEIDGIIKGE